MLGLSIGVALTTLSYQANASCSYNIESAWNSGFVAKITMTNNSTAAINGWNIGWEYSGNNRVTNVWNAVWSGNNPYSASNMSWNGSIQSGQSITFGFQGTSNGTAETPTFSGEICGDGGDGGDGGDSSNTGVTFRVENGKITKNGEVKPMQCGAWFGLEGRHEPSNDPTNPSGAPMELYMGNTFWANGNQGTGRTIQQDMDEMKSKGINTIRLPIAPQTLETNNPQGVAAVFKNHPSVRATNSRQALEDFIKLADQNDLDIILDIHSCSNYLGWRAGRLDATPPYADRDRDNYDYKRENYSCGAAGAGVTVHEYNEQLWLDDLRTLAGFADSLNVDNILGIDIFNEPWDYSWNEWKTLAEDAYQVINEINPNVLIFVEGIGSARSDGATTAHGSVDTNPNWGENFFSFANAPLDIPQDRLVLSPHTYGPSVFVQKQFMDPTQPQCADLEGDAAGDAHCNVVINPTLLRSGWEEHFGYLKDQGYAIVIGEFGGHYDWPLSGPIRDQDRWGYLQPGLDEQWQTALVDYLVDKDMEACYWAINPESDDTGGLYTHAYDPRSNTSGWGEWTGFDEAKWNMLNRLWQ
ncbi:MAG: cellulase family glycosylhydrolase [Reinekea sp.]